MRYVMQLRDDRQARLKKHPFFDWVTSEEVPLQDRLSFLPALSNFAMGFRDVNKWVLRYPAASDRFERTINAHTFEDQTHSRLYLEDWERLGMDQRLRWRASDTLWWLFLAETNETARAQGISFLSMGEADGGDPLLRFAHSEVIEACGHVFFEAVAPIATALTGRTGVEYRYLGPYHLARETGRVDTEGLFEDVVLDEPRRERALNLANTMFDIFEEMFDSFLSYAETYVAAGTRPRRPRQMLAAGRPPGGVAAHASGSRCGPPRVDGPVSAAHGPIQELLEERKRRTTRHPFYHWLHARGDLTALQALQRFLPMWAMDIMGYRDLNHYAMRYPRPVSRLEHAVNCWADDLSTHNVLYLHDWVQLGLDDVLGWTGGDTLRFCFLDPQMDVHRHNIVKFTRLAAAHPDPVLRLWLMHALESSGDAFFHHTRQLAAEVEGTSGVRLDYLADRHDVAHQRPPRPSQAEPVTFKDAPLTLEARHIALHMVEVVFDSIDEQLDISLDVALSNKFAIPS
jgi:hypothetical protein